jgi:hypothetical protein
MVVVVDHFCFNQWSIFTSWPDKTISDQQETGFDEFLVGPEVLRVLRHVPCAGSHLKAPRIAIRIPIANHNSRTTVYAEVQFGIAARAKSRARARIWVQQREIERRKGEVPVSICEILSATRIEKQVGLSNRTDRQEYETESMVHLWEELALILEVKNAAKRVAIN